MNWANRVRKLGAVKRLKDYADTPKVGRAIRWSARQLRAADAKSQRFVGKNREHDKAQAELLDRYRKVDL